MKIKHISIFNLIEIFRQGKKNIVKSIRPKEHCDKNKIHDFYCGYELPYIGSSKKYSDFD